MQKPCATALFFVHGASLVLVLLLACQSRPTTPINTPLASTPTRTLPQTRPVTTLPSDTLPTEVGVVYSLALSPDGRNVVWYESVDVVEPRGELRRRQQHAIRVWSISKQSQVIRWTIERQATSLCYSPDGRSLAIAYFSGAVQLWDTKTWKRHATLGEPGRRKDDVYGITFSDAGKLLATGDEDDRVRVWELSTRQPRLLGRLPYTPTHLSFSVEERYLAVADFRGNIVIWDVSSGEKHWSFAAHAHPITKRVGVQGVAFHPDGRTLVTSGTDGMVRVWDVPNKKEIRHFDVKVGEVNAITLSSDGTMVAVAGGRWNIDAPGGVRIWDVRTARQLAELGPLDHGVSCLCFSNDGEKLAVGTYGRPSGQIILYDTSGIGGKTRRKTKP